MKKNVLRLTTVMAAAFVIVVMLLAFARTDAYAVTRYVEIAQNTDTNVTWNISSSEANSDLVTYFTIKPTKTGIITFSILSDDYSGYASLCNSGEALLSKGKDDARGDWIWGGSSYTYFRKIIYGVKKGKTYLLKIQGYPGYDSSTGTYHARVKWTNSKIAPSKSGSKKSKAKSIKRKKTIKGLIVAGDKKAKWYKITSNRKNNTIYFKAPKSDEYIDMTVYYRQYVTKGKLKNSGKLSASRTGNTVKYYLNQIGSKKKFTAYIRITRKGKSSGYYTLKWK